MKLSAAATTQYFTDRKRQSEIQFSLSSKRGHYLRKYGNSSNDEPAKGVAYRTYLFCRDGLYWR